VSQPADEPQPRTREATRSSRNAPQHTRAQTTPTPGGPSVFGVAGPANWPGAFEDMLGYTLWPDKYGERLRAHGIGDIMSALFVPTGAAAGAGHTTAQAKAENSSRSDADATASPCAGGQPASEDDWPARPIAQAMALNEMQRPALAQLRNAVGEAAAAVRAACRDEPPNTSAERLQAMQSSLWAVRDATMLVRAPLINFYRSLTDEQKKHFTFQASQPDPRAAQINQRATQGRGGQPPQIPREVARMCGMSAANEWPLRQIEHAIAPNKQQKASLDMLQKKATEMGQLLVASCLKPIAATPEARVDAALDRLTAMLFAITNITLALNDFHGQLSDDQKAKLAPFGL
jgi:hypothetical protein